MVEDKEKLKSMKKEGKGKTSKGGKSDGKTVKSQALKNEKIKKAIKTAKAAKSSSSRKVRKVRYSVHFYRPRTLKTPRKPKYARRIPSDFAKMDKFAIIKSPITTEAAMKKIEEINTLVFLVDIRANKYQIRQAVKELYDVSCSQVNTLVRPDGKKKAYVRLTSDYDALDVANKIGII